MRLRFYERAHRLWPRSWFLAHWLGLKYWYASERAEDAAERRRLARAAVEMLERASELETEAGSDYNSKLVYSSMLASAALKSGDIEAAARYATDLLQPVPSHGVRFHGGLGHLRCGWT
jgi:hypothetical protein